MNYNDEENGCPCGFMEEDNKDTTIADMSYYQGCSCDDGEELTIKVLGSGCTKCNQLEKNVKDALSELYMFVPIMHVKDFEKIASYGVMQTPALVINEVVVSYGKVPSKDEIKAIIKEKTAK